MEESGPQAMDMFLGGRRDNVGGIRPRQQAIQVFGNVRLRQAPDEESQCLGVMKQAFPLRLRPTVEDFVGGQAEGMQAVQLSHGEVQLGADIVDARGQVGHLQAAVLRLRVAEHLQQRAHLPVGALPRGSLRPAHGTQEVVILAGLNRCFIRHGSLLPPLLQACP